MAYWLKRDMTPVKLADEAIRALGLEPHSTPTRGGTDGSRLTERGLPAPNLFNGSHNWHGPLEWVCVQDMDLAVKMCVELVQLWEKKGAGYAGWGTKKRRRSRTRAASTNGRWAKFSCTSRLTSIICASGFVRQKPSGSRPCRRMNHSPHL
ncbi:MAG TPA: hypothetical protein VI793_08080 [Anaerolineales bacterium]|nr:hypothetical protein [Anaerolineales bacterium]